MKRIMLAFVALFVLAAPALAQREDAITRTPAARPSAAVRPGFQLPIDPLGLNGKVPGTTDPLQGLLDALDAKLLPDLQYALKLATASGSKVTAPCYQAWITIIETRQKAGVDDQGVAMPEPDPGIVTKFERMVELRNALQPDSPFMIACSPVASMVKKDIVGFIGTVISGGAGLAALVPGL